MYATIVFALALIQPTWADDGAPIDPVEAKERQGEMERLSGEIRTLGRRQVWAGVERKYTQLLNVDVSAPGDVHLIAAYSARERGELLEVHTRLMRAANDKPNETVIDWLYDLDHNFGRVELVADRRRSAVLEASEMPLDPNRRKAVEAAVKACLEQGRFHGLLPRGAYRFVGQDFTVDPGISVRVEVSPKVRRQGLNEPTIVYRELPQAAVKEKK